MSSLLQTIVRVCSGPEILLGIPEEKSTNFGKLKRVVYKEPELPGMWIRCRVVEKKGCAQRE